MASQKEIEQSIEALNMLMLDLDPALTQVPKSHSAPSGEGGVVTTQPSFSQTQARPSYQADAAIHDRGGVSSGGYPLTFQQVAAEPPRPSMNQQRPAISQHVAFPSETEGQAPMSQSTVPSSTFGVLQLKPLNIYPSSTTSQSPEPQESQRSYSASSSPLPKESEPEDANYKLDGLVAHRVAGKITSFIILSLPAQRYNSNSTLVNPWGDNQQIHLTFRLHCSYIFLCIQNANWNKISREM